MNSLEDAFVNIAKEEEKLLEDLKKYGYRRHSITKKKDQLDISNDIQEIIEKPNNEDKFSAADNLLNDQ